MAEQISPLSVAPAGLTDSRLGRERWWKLMDTDIGIIPLPIYVLLLVVVTIFTLTGRV